MKHKREADKKKSHTHFQKILTKTVIDGVESALLYLDDFCDATPPGCETEPDLEEHGGSAGHIQGDHEGGRDCQ